jgi:hypothetical protein
MINVVDFQVLLNVIECRYSAPQSHYTHKASVLTVPYFFTVSSALEAPPETSTAWLAGLPFSLHVFSV